MSLKTLSPNFQARLASIICNVGTGEKLLNLGCGDGYFNPFLAARFKQVYAVDVNSMDLHIAKTLYHLDNIKYAKASAADLPFKDNTFDRIVCSDVLEHINDHKAAIKEIARTLKPGGVAIITVPSADYPFTCDPINWVCERLFDRHIPIGLWGFGHLRLYAMSDLEKLFKQNKLRPIKKIYFLHFFNCIFESYYLINLLQPFTKSDPKNLDTAHRILIDNAKNQKNKRPSNSAFKKPPWFLRKIRDTIMQIDHTLHKNSKKSVGLFVMFQK